MSIIENKMIYFIFYRIILFFLYFIQYWFMPNVVFKANYPIVFLSIDYALLIKTFFILKIFKKNKKKLFVS